MTDRPTKQVANAGHDELTYSATINGTDQSWQLPAGEAISVPLSDDELAAYKAAQNTPPPPPPLPPPGSLITQTDGTLAIVITTDRAAQTLNVIPLPGTPLTLPATEATPTL